MGQLQNHFVNKNTTFCSFIHMFYILWKTDSTLQSKLIIWDRRQVKVGAYKALKHTIKLFFSCFFVLTLKTYKLFLYCVLFQFTTLDNKKKIYGIGKSTLVDIFIKNVSLILALTNIPESSCSQQRRASGRYTAHGQGRPPPWSR